MTTAVEVAPMLGSAPIAARTCGISRSLFLRLNSTGKTPRAVRLGRRVLWNLEEIREWAAAGCPAREQWEAR